MKTIKKKETNHKRLKENKLKVDGVEADGGWARWGMGIKEGTCDEHWVLYVSNESLDSTSETGVPAWLSQLSVQHPLSSWFQVQIRLSALGKEPPSDLPSLSLSVSLSRTLSLSFKINT